MSAGPMDPGSGDDAQTAISAEDAAQLIPAWVTTTAQLDALEQQAILAARRRWLRRPPDLTGFLAVEPLKRLHADMFDGVWRWAGKWRTTTTNLGIAWHEIPVAMRNLVDDAAVWVDTGRPTDEAAVALHHRLTRIHPFVNGNGRHARLAADIVAVAAGRPAFSWGRASLAEVGSEPREGYLAALRAADKGNLEPLVAFARS